MASGFWESWPKSPVFLWACQVLLGFRLPRLTPYSDKVLDVWTPVHPEEKKSIIGEDEEKEDCHLHRSLEADSTSHSMTF